MAPFVYFETEIHQSCSDIYSHFRWLGLWSMIGKRRIMHPSRYSQFLPCFFFFYIWLEHQLLSNHDLLLALFIRDMLWWRHNELDGVLEQQPHDCLLNRIFGRRSKKTSKLRVTGLCAGNSPGTGEFPAQMASNAENVSIWWRHHVSYWPRQW